MLKYPIDRWRSHFRMVQFRESARIKKIRRQSAILAFPDEIVRHPPRNFRESASDFIQSRRWRRCLKFLAEVLDEGQVELGAIRRLRALGYRDGYVLMFRQLQGLERPEHTVFVDSFNLHCHDTLIVSRIRLFVFPNAEHPEHLSVVVSFAQPSS